MRWKVEEKNSNWLGLVDLKNQNSKLQFCCLFVISSFPSIHGSDNFPFLPRPCSTTALHRVACYIWTFFPLDLWICVGHWRDSHRKRKTNWDWDWDWGLMGSLVFNYGCVHCNRRWWERERKDKRRRNNK